MTRSLVSDWKEGLWRRTRGEGRRSLLPRLFSVACRQARALQMPLALMSLFFLGLGLLSSCQEELPVYQDPRSVLKGSVGEQYLLSSTENVVRLEFAAVNRYDETFQAEGVLRGEMTLTLGRRPEVRKTLILGPSNVVKGQYNPTSHELTMDPGDTVRFAVYWDYTDDEGRDLRRTEFDYKIDSACPMRQVALEELFSVRGTVRIYDKTMG